MSDDAGAALVRDLTEGRWKAKLVAAVLRLGIADALGDDALPVEVLASRLDVGPRRLGRLLRLAAGLGLFEEPAPGRFRNSPASSLLRTGAPGNLRDEARHVLSAWTRLTWDHLEHSVRTGAGAFVHATGTSVFAFLRDHPAEAEAFHAFQAEVSRRNVRPLLAAGCLPREGTVVDVGGGTGALLAGMLAAAPRLSGVLYDLPEVIAGARRLASPRLCLAAGDFFEEVPAGADTYLLSHVLHDWPDARAVRILERVAAAMHARSRLLVIESVEPDAGPPGLLVSYLDLQMLAAWEGRERTVGEYRALLDRAGLDLVASRQVDQRTSLTVLTAAPRPLGG